MQASANIAEKHEVTSETTYLSIQYLKQDTMLMIIFISHYNISLEKQTGPMGLHAAAKHGIMSYLKQYQPSHFPRFIQQLCITFSPVSNQTQIVMVLSSHLHDIIDKTLEHVVKLSSNLYSETHARGSPLIQSYISSPSAVNTFLLTFGWELRQTHLSFNVFFLQGFFYFLCLLQIGNKNPTGLQEKEYVYS